MFSIHLDMCLGIELLGHMEALCLISLFEELPNSFPRWLHYFTVPQTTRYEGSSFSTSLTTLVIFYFSNASGYKEVYCGFDLYFHDN